MALLSAPANRHVSTGRAPYADMKAQAHRMERRQSRRFEAELGAATNAHFSRCPTLCGFSVRDAAALSGDRSAPRPASELLVTEVSVYPLRGLHVPGELCDEIVAALAALIDERPEICELMRERTFARVLH